LKNWPQVRKVEMAKNNLELAIIVTKIKEDKAKKKSCTASV